MYLLVWLILHTCHFFPFWAFFSFLEVASNLVTRVIDFISITSLFLYLVPHGVDFFLLLCTLSPLAYSYSLSFRGEVAQSPKFVLGFSLVDNDYSWEDSTSTSITWSLDSRNSSPSFDSFLHSTSLPFGTILWQGMCYTTSCNYLILARDRLSLIITTSNSIWLLRGSIPHLVGI